MKVFGGSICGHKHQSSEFVSTGHKRGSYPLYVCTLPIEPGSAHRQKHYDNVHNVHF